MRALVVSILPALATATAAADPVNPFRCLGEAEAMAKDLTNDQIRDEVRKRVEAVPKAGVELCVVAELLRRIGDGDAVDWYEKAIEADPEEPGWELWYGHYLRNVRGAAGPHVEQAERHYYRALNKLEARRKSGTPPPFDEITDEWVQKGLLSLYQMDGQPLLWWKSYRYDPSGLMAPGLFLSSRFSISADTHDFYYSAEMRNFTSEKAFSESSQRLDRPLTARETYDLIRAPLRYELVNRARIRHNWLGAIDLLHHWFKAEDSQIIQFNQPTVFTDVDVTELGVGYARVFDLYPLFDLGLEASVRRISRTGVVEYLPDATETFNTYEVSPTLSRFLGPDKLTVGLTWVWLDVPDATEGPEVERARDHVIRAIQVDYAMYRSVVLPQLHRGSLRLRRMYTRGWHFYGGYADDTQVFGTRQVLRRDVYLGSSLKGLGDYDVTLQGTLYTAGTSYYDATMLDAGLIEDESQSNAQVRTSLILSRRLIDEEASPGMPRGWAGFSPASLVLVVPLHWDVAAEGGDDYENVRTGAELWLKAHSAGLGGTTFLLTAGYDFQYFHRVSRAMHMAHLDLRVGW
jgi:hypothetical protein